jgi:hypothetical protein
MRRAGFDAVGGYAELSVGEDFDFEARSPPDRWLYLPSRTSDLFYIYRWGNNVNHISALDADRLGQQGAWEIQEAQHRALTGGLVVPGFDRDYWADLIAAAARLPDLNKEEHARLVARLQPYHALGPI